MIPRNVYSLSHRACCCNVPIRQAAGGEAEVAVMNHDDSKCAVITVGAGRGFVIDGERHRLVITAAHCLPFFPPCASTSHREERTYEALLGPLGGRSTVWTECLFADPIGDIAVLGPPDNQAIGDQADAYKALVGAAVALPIAAAPKRGPAWLLSLDGRWCRCDVSHSNGPLWIWNALDGIEGGMSGSPILADDCWAIGVVCISGRTPGEKHTEGGPNPQLVSNLPGWLVRELVRLRAKR